MLTVGREIVSAIGWEIVLGTEPGTESINLLLSDIRTPIQTLAEKPNQYSSKLILYQQL